MKRWNIAVLLLLLVLTGCRGVESCPAAPDDAPAQEHIEPAEPPAEKLPAADVPVEKPVITRPGAVTDVPAAPADTPDDGDIVDIENTVDPEMSYATALEVIWEDEENEYYFPNIISHMIIVHYADGTQEDVKAALESGRATLADLDRFGIHYLTEAKTPTADK